MQQAQILAYGVDEPLAGRLQKLGHDEGIWVRAVQQLRACRDLLRDAGPAVLIVMLGKDVAEELALVEEVGRVWPDTAVIVISDTDNPALAALAWDLGARCVLQPPLSIELLPPIVVKFLTGDGR